MNKCICNLKDGEEKNIETGCWTYLRICKENNSYTLIAYGDDRIEFKIDYCPKCGRKLI